MLISVAADVGVAQLVNPLATAKVAIDRRIFQLEP
jgi:acetamidase/formamidase